ncbi:hypothetical protein [Acetobacter oryzifermentans]|uniref:hypothetical protein n=1 Tax=Acetobacter oryzifermentans TaxID=1633874 RepID=UPI0007B0722B|nr:hypothetical protein [Acetobacter oryzifermentans]
MTNDSTNLITPSMREGELRILDTDLAKRLGFAAPRMIRKLIKRYLPELDKIGPRSTVERVINGGNATEYYLNRKQAIFITAKSETVEATDITIEIIHRFDSYERGQIPNATPKPKRPRKPPMLATFKTGYGIAKELGLDDNQAASHAGRYCLNKCGENPLPALGLDSRPTPTEANYYTVTELGKEIGLSGQAMNKLLIEQGYQVKVSGGSSSAAYEPTEKGKPHARLFDEVRKGGRGSQQALKWKHVIVSLLHPFTKTPA